MYITCMYVCIIITIRQKQRTKTIEEKVKKRIENIKKINTFSSLKLKAFLHQKIPQIKSSPKLREDIER